MTLGVLKILLKTENVNNFAGDGVSYMYYTLKQVEFYSVHFLCGVLCSAVAGF